MAGAQLVLVECESGNQNVDAGGSASRFRGQEWAEAVENLETLQVLHMQLSLQGHSRQSPWTQEVKGP